MKVEELKDEKLDLWTAKAEGHLLKPSLREGWLEVRTNDGAQHFLGFYPSDPDDKDRYGDEPFYSPSTNWTDGGPIIEREKIVWNWINTPNGCHAVCGPWELKDKSPLVAAMRYYVYRKFGEEVDDS